MSENKFYYMISFTVLFLVQYVTKQFELVLLSGFVLGVFLNFESPFKTMAISQVFVLAMLILVQGIHWLAVSKFGAVLGLPAWGLFSVVIVVSTLSVALPALSGNYLKLQFKKG